MMSFMSPQAYTIMVIDPSLSKRTLLIFSYPPHLAFSISLGKLG